MKTDPTAILQEAIAVSMLPYQTKTYWKARLAWLQDADSATARFETLPLRDKIPIYLTILAAMVAVIEKENGGQPPPGFPTWESLLNQARRSDEANTVHREIAKAANREPTP